MQSLHGGGGGGNSYTSAYVEGVSYVPFFCCCGKQLFSEAFVDMFLQGDGVHITCIYIRLLPCPPSPPYCYDFSFFFLISGVDICVMDIFDI